MADQVVEEVVTEELAEPETTLEERIDAELGLPVAPKTEVAAEESVAETAEEEKVAEEQEEQVTDPEKPVEQPKTTEVATPSDEDLFIEVVDAEGVTHKITTIDDLPEDFSPKNNRQILEIIKATQELDAERNRRDEAATTEAEQAEIKANQDAQFKSWDKEIVEMVKGKRLDNNGQDRVNDVFGYMNEINASRIKAGNPNLITSFEDALDKFEAKERADGETEAKKTELDTAKKKAALIGKGSSSASTKPFFYRAGQYRSMDDIPLT